ncbi:I78 family peptidase inhibitor [Sphingomonas sp. RS2018]
MIRVAVIAGLALLGGCTVTRTVTPGPCAAADVQGFIGRVYDATTEAELRKWTGARTIRPVRPGQMVTMDFRPDRLTVRIDDAGRIVSLACG